MTRMQQIKAIVRTECVHDVVEALRDIGITRFYVSRIHALGAGVDPRRMKPSWEDGEAYADKAKIECYTAEERTGEVIERIRTCAATGHRGDGVVIVADVVDVVNVRTGDHDGLALQ